ncbi:MAG: DUF2127 domain-containing protein [Longimicrobiales bacterium]
MIRALVLALLVVTAYLGLSNGPSDFRTAESTGQFVVALAVTSYGIAGLASAYGLWRRKQWARPLTVLWALGALTAATVAPRAYGGGEVSIWAVLTGSVAVAVIAGAVLMFVFRHLQQPSAE